MMKTLTSSSLSSPSLSLPRYTETDSPPPEYCTMSSPHGSRSPYEPRSISTLDFIYYTSDSELPILIALIFNTLLAYFRLLISNDEIYLDNILVIITFSHFPLLLFITLSALRSSGKLSWLTRTGIKASIWIALVILWTLQFSFAIGISKWNWGYTRFYWGE